MILINLLPHREAARKRRRQAFFALLGSSAVVGSLVAGGIYLWFLAQIADQQSKNELLKQEIVKLDNQIKDVARLQQEIAALRARQQAVEDLQADRNMPVHLLNELVAQLPDGIYLTSMKQNNQVVVISGVAQSQERVSELLRNLTNGSPWLTRPELIEIIAGGVSLGKDHRRVSNFSVRMTMLRSSEIQKAASAAAAAAASAPAAAGAKSAASAPSKV